MLIEINLWVRSNNRYKTHININHKEVLETTTLMSIREFCEQAPNLNISLGALETLVNDPGTDLDAMYGMSKEGSLVVWNTKKDWCILQYNNKLYTLTQNKVFTEYPNRPNICFKIFL